MVGKNEMTKLYVQTAPAFLAFLEAEAKKLQGEVAKLQGSTAVLSGDESVEGGDPSAPEMEVAIPEHVLSSTPDGETESVENESPPAVATAEGETDDNKRNGRRLGGFRPRRKT